MLEKNKHLTSRGGPKQRFITTNGSSQEIPEPLCLAAIVVGPPKEGIQKKPSVNRPLKKEMQRSAMFNLLHMSNLYIKSHKMLV